MPIFENKIIANEIHLLIWQVAETEEELQKQMQMGDFEQSELSKISNKAKRIEFLASRLALEKLVISMGGNFNGIYKDIHGKPFLIDSDWHISLSHSIEMVGVAISKKKALGLDIEKPSEKISKVLPRLFTEQELALLADNLIEKTTFWCAKECLYKLYGKRHVDFKKNLKLYNQENSLMGEINMPESNTVHQIYQFIMQQYCIVLAY